MNRQKILELANFIESRTNIEFRLSDCWHCVTGFYRRMVGDYAYRVDRDEIAADLGIGAVQMMDIFHARWDGVQNWDRTRAETVAYLRRLAGVVPIVNKSEGPIAITVAVRKTAKTRELEPA